MARTPQEIFAHHAEVLIAGDLDGIVCDYADDAVFITPRRRPARQGRRARGFTKLLEDVPNADWEVPTQFFEGDVLFIEWRAVAANSRPRTASTPSSSATGRSRCKRSLHVDH